MKEHLLDENNCIVKAPRQLSAITFLAGIGLGLLSWPIIHYMGNIENSGIIIFFLAIFGIIIIERYEKDEYQNALRYYYNYYGLNIIKEEMQDKDRDICKSLNDIGKMQEEKEKVLHKCKIYRDIIMRNKAILTHEFIIERLESPNYDSNGELMSSTTIIDMKLKDEIVNKL